MAATTLLRAADLVVQGVAPDLSVHAPFVDGDHDVAPPSRKGSRKAPHAAPAVRSSLARAARAAAGTPQAETAAPYQLPPDVADKLAAMKASAFNAQLAVLRQSTAPNAKYQIGRLLEGVGDSATRKYMRAQHAANNDGESFTTMLEHTDLLDEHGKKNAIGLMSTERDAATDKLAAMDPAKRADLEDQAAVWADKLAKVHRSSDRDDSESADRVASILGPRTPEELELIRARVRLNTSGTDERTLHEELDRTFTGRDKDIAMARLGRDHVHVAATQLVDATMESDPERVHRIVKELGPEKLAALRAQNPLLLAQVTSGMPAEYRAQIDAELGGRQAEADGARIASLLQPVDVDASDSHDLGTLKRKLAQKETQSPENMIAELQKMSASELTAARAAWDATHDQSWDAPIAQQYEGVDTTTRLRIEAAARGDTRGERALRLRQGMRTFDQDLIDQALANPDLKLFAQWHALRSQRGRSSV